MCGQQTFNGQLQIIIVNIVLFQTNNFNFIWKRNINIIYVCTSFVIDMNLMQAKEIYVHTILQIDNYECMGQKSNV